MISMGIIIGASHGIGPAKCSKYRPTPCSRNPIQL